MRHSSLAVTISLFVFLSVGQAIAGPAVVCRELMSRFQDIVDASEKPLSEVRLPSTLRLSVNRSDVALSYMVYRNFWRSSFNRRDFRMLIEKLAEGRALDRDEYHRLKAIRGSSKKLRNAYAAFDERHEFPDVIDEFTTRLGHVQDGLNIKSGAFTQKEAIQLSAFFNEKTEKKFDEEIENFSAAKTGNFKKWFNSEVDKLDQGLKKDSVTSKEFHASRKIVSRFVATFDAIALLYPSSENVLMTEFLGSLNEEMGLIHDASVLQSFSREMNDSKDILVFPEPIRDALTRLVSKLRKDVVWE